MTFHEAVVKSMRAYYSGLSPKELNGASGKRPKYAKSYFDKVGREYSIEPYEVKKKKGTPSGR